MGLFSGIAKIAKSAYRYVRYGKQVGKTAKNGTKVYKRGGTTTGVDANGKVIHQAKTFKKDKYTTETHIHKPLPFDGSKNTRIVKDYENGTIWSVSKTTDRFGREKDFRVIQGYRDENNVVNFAIDSPKGRTEIRANSGNK